VGTHSRLLEKHSRQSWLRECLDDSVAHLAKGGYFEESKINVDLFDTFFGYYMIPYVFHSFDVYTIILQHKNKGNP
jgi:hypothetical protein